MAKTAVLELLDSGKLNSRKIWVTEKIMKFSHCEELLNLGMVHPVCKAVHEESICSLYDMLGSWNPNVIFSCLVKDKDANFWNTAERKYIQMYFITITHKIYYTKYILIIVEAWRTWENGCSIHQSIFCVLRLPFVSEVTLFRVLSWHKF